MEEAQCCGPTEPTDSAVPMKCYIGTKIIRAYEEDKGDMGPGYVVIYPDGYKSWSPKAVFEESYREITPNEKKMI